MTRRRPPRSGELADHGGAERRRRRRSRAARATASIGMFTASRSAARGQRRRHRRPPRAPAGAWPWSRPGRKQLDAEDHDGEATGSPASRDQAEGLRAEDQAGAEQRGEPGDRAPDSWPAYRHRPRSRLVRLAGASVRRGRRPAGPARSRRRRSPRRGRPATAGGRPHRAHLAGTHGSCPTPVAVAVLRHARANTPAIGARRHAGRRACASTRRGIDRDR